LLPALPEVTLKVTLSLPGFRGRNLTLSVLEEPAEIFPTRPLNLMPRPLTVSLTPTAASFPEFEIRTR
jgi:hypothetical protein